VDARRQAADRREHEDRKTELWRCSRPAASPKIDINVDGMWQFRLHPDGRRIASSWENNEEVRAIENLLPRLSPTQRHGGPAGADHRVGCRGCDRCQRRLFSFRLGDRDLAVRALPGGNKRRLTDKGRGRPLSHTIFHTSRDGRQVAYDWMQSDASTSFASSGSTVRSQSD
jgi:hypothetical protein